jgi:hypothetical protein
MPEEPQPDEIGGDSSYTDINGALRDWVKDSLRKNRKLD